MNYRIDVLIDEKSLAAKVEALGKQIEKDYKDAEEIILVGLLRGSTIFLADLARHINLDARIDFMVVSSYGNSMNSSRDVQIKKDLEEEIRGRHVIIVEDIIDTGYTLERVKDFLELRDPASLKICTLLDKPDRREVNVPVDYIGFTIPDVFVIGYGIDYARSTATSPTSAKSYNWTDSVLLLNHLGLGVARLAVGPALCGGSVRTCRYGPRSAPPIANALVSRTGRENRQSSADKPESWDYNHLSAYGENKNQSLENSSFYHHYLTIFIDPGRTLSHGIPERIPPDGRRRLPLRQRALGLDGYQ